MKKTFLTLALALAAAGASAEPITASQALSIARRFVTETPGLSHVNASALSLASSPAASMAKGISTTAPAYYVCNINSDGFVIVSGDDRFKPVLGYSLNGAFNEADMPDGMRYWLQFLSNEMTAAIEAGYEPGAITTNVMSSAVHSIEPLIKTKWDQVSPYNNKLNGNMTGCVATGMAQVMNYWQYPIHGTGSHQGAYSPNYEANFGATTYDWANMLPMYGYNKELNPDGGWETKEQVDAVSTLMLHLGVATDMRWSKESSGTPTPFGAYALTTYFGYNPDLYIESRDQLSFGAWKALIIDQLQTGHPLCYSGAMENGYGGHFFVCDGYDASTGKFHFNWGWSGACDGYYELTSLEPGMAGAGAGFGSFNSWQSIFVNVQPQQTGEYRPNFSAKSISFAAAGTNISIQTNMLTNNCAKQYEGAIGLAIYNADGTMKKFVDTEVRFPPAGFNIGSNYDGVCVFTANIAGTEDGTYTLCAAVCDKQGKVFPVRANYSNHTYYSMVVKGQDVTFSPINNEINLTEASPLVLTSNSEGNMFQNRAAHFQITVKNNSATEFNDEIGVTISGGRGSSQNITRPACIAPGETKTIEIYGIPTLNIKDGYTAKACYGNDGTYSTFGDAITVNIKPETDGIQSITIDNNNATTYNTAGQQIPATTRGLIIQTGKKSINK